MKLLIPMDFTLVATNAFKFAYEMYPSAEFYCLYCMSSNTKDKVTSVIKNGETRTSLLKDELENIIKRATGSSELPSNMSIKVLQGEAVSVIQKFAKEIDPDFILMGTRDNYGLFDKWLGTVSLGVVKSCDYPTYLIPRHAKYLGFKKSLVAADSSLQKTSILNWLKNWNREFRSFIKFLHVQQSDDTTIDSITDGIVTSLIQEEISDIAFEIENIKSENLADTLLSKAYNLGANLIIAAPGKQSFIQTLLYKSISRELIEKSSIPLLFLNF